MYHTHVVAISSPLSLTYHCLAFTNRVTALPIACSHTSTISVAIRCLTASHLIPSWYRRPSAPSTHRVRNYQQ